MRIVSILARTFLFAICLVGFSGCDSEKKPTPKTDTHAEHDHGDDHDHGDEHDHGDAHEHSDDDKAHDDHAGHDHDGHAHSDHDHAEQIDAKAAGLNSDDLVSLDEPPVPDNYNDAVKQLVKMRDSIRDGFKNNKIDDAHGPLHDVGNLLEGIETLGEKSSMDADAKKAISSAVEELFDAFGEVDAKLHDDEKGKDYADVSDAVDSAVKKLLSHVKE